MRTLKRLITPLVMGLALLLGQGDVALAANYPLELTNIAPAGTRFSSTNRIYRAYPGIEYDIRAAVIGGDFPYSFSLTNAPDGMTVNVLTGEIRWPNPTANAQPTLVVRDSAGASVSATWAIQVTTTGFRFVNAAAATSGNGTLTSPWRTMGDVYNNASASDIIYFRAGTYDQLSLPRRGVGGDWELVDWTGKASIWLAYPGERPVMDFGYRPGGTEHAPLARFDADNVYVDGLETANSRLIAFQFVSGGGNGPTFRRLRMHTLGPGIDGSNASFIMTTTDPTPSNNMVVQDCEFWDVTGTAVTIKIYAQQKLLIEDTRHHDSPYGVELKDDIRQFTVRNNRFYNISVVGLGGNMHETTTYGEMLFNNSRSTGIALNINQDGMAGRIDIYRNTLIGRVQVNSTSSANGPFSFSNNVIVNNDAGVSGSHVLYVNVTDPSRIVMSNNLVGYPSDNLVDANGDLTPAYESYTGTYGYQLAPRAPRNVRIIRN